jgi:hypothetical protein
MYRNAGLDTWIYRRATEMKRVDTSISSLEIYGTPIV